MDKDSGGRSSRQSGTARRRSMRVDPFIFPLEYEYVGFPHKVPPGGEDVVVPSNQRAAFFDLRNEVDRLKRDIASYSMDRTSSTPPSYHEEPI